MKNKIQKKIYLSIRLSSLIVFLCLLPFSCQDDLEWGSPVEEGSLAVQSRDVTTLELSHARLFYEQAQKELPSLTRQLSKDTLRWLSPYTPSLSGPPSWLYYACNQNDTLLAVDVDLTDRIMQDYVLQESWEGYQKYKQLKYRRSYTRYVYTRHLQTGVEQGFFMTIVPSLNCTRNYSTRIERNTYLYRNKYLSGYVLFHNLDGTFSNGWQYQDGKIVGRVLSPRKAQSLGISGDPLLLGQCAASYQVAPKKEQPRIQTRSSGESGGGWDIDGGWIPGGEVVGSGGGGGGSIVIIGGGGSGGTTIPGGGGGGGGGGGTSGGYEPDPPKEEPVVEEVVIPNDTLKIIYDIKKSDLNQEQIDKLAGTFQLFAKGKTGEFCIFILDCEGTLLAFSIPSEGMENKIASFSPENNKISFKDEQAITQLAPLSEELFHAVQYNGYYGLKMDNSVANYDFEAKVLVDINIYKSKTTAAYVGNYQFYDAKEQKYLDYAMDYDSFIEAMANASEWTNDMQVKFDTLVKIWNEYNKQYRPETSYGKQKYQEGFIPETLKDSFNYKM